jgi:hypothetical protein
MMAQNPRLPQYKRKPSHVYQQKGMEQFDVEVGYGGGWISLNDKLNFRVAADSINSTALTQRRIETQNPVLEGKYLIHAVPEHVTEMLHVYVYGQSMVDAMEKARGLIDAFTQFDFQVRVTMDSHREYWRCQTADWTMERTHTNVHNQMVGLNFQVPRFPTPYYEALV